MIDKYIYSAVFPANLIIKPFQFDQTLNTQHSVPSAGTVDTDTLETLSNHSILILQFYSSLITFYLATPF